MIKNFYKKFIFLSFLIVFFNISLISVKASGVGGSYDDCCRYDGGAPPGSNLIPGQCVNFNEASCVNIPNVGNHTWVPNSICNSQNMCVSVTPVQQQLQPTTPPVQFSVQIPIPGSGIFTGQKITISNDTLGQYIAALYQFFVGALAIVAVVMIMIGGFQWLMAAGSSERVSHAKETILGAVVGLILALTSYLLLYTINPNLVQMKTLNVGYVNPDVINFGTSLVSLTHEEGNGYEFYADPGENRWLAETAAALDRVIDKLQDLDPPLILHIEAGSRGIDKQKQLYSQICGTDTSCSNSCATACNPNPACGKNCSHANAIDVRTSMYIIASEYEVVQDILKSEGFCKYPAEDNHFENPKWTSSCNMNY